MSNLVFEPKWNASINQVEAGEEIRGGKDGTANIATKQLAENIFYLKDNIYSLVGYIPPDLSEDMADIVQNTKDKFDSVINQIVIQNDAILAESRDRIAEVTATNAALALERDERIAKYDAINADLSAESAARIQAILDEQFQRSEEILSAAIAQEALLAAESKVIQDKLIADALELNNTITALGTRVDLDLAGLATTITQTSTDASNASEANANIINALKLEYEGNKASVLQKYTALATESLAQAELLTNLRASVDGAQTELTNFKSATATKDLATAAEITALKTTVSGNEASFNAQITTVSDKVSANTTQLTTLSSKMDTVEGQTADLIVKNTAVTTLTESTASALTLLQSAYGLSTASFNERITTVTNDNQALTTKVNNLETTTGDSLSAIRLKQEALTTEDAALATSISTLTTTFEGQTAQFTDQLSTLASDNLASLQKTENLRAQLVGGYDGSDLDQVSEGLLFQEKIARVTDKESLVQQIGLLSAGVGEQFDPKEIWHFSSEPEGWVGGIFEEGYLRVTNETVISPLFTLVGVSYRYMKMRVVRVGTPTWEGKLTYNNMLAIPGEIVIPEPLFVEDIATIDIDTKWTGDITDIQLKLASTGDELNYILIDWVAIGRPSPGASSAALLDLKTSSASRDEALTQSISQLNAALNTKTATLESTINTKTETLTTAQQTQATNLVTLESKIDNIDSTLSSSIIRNDETITTKHNALAATVTTLKSDTDTASALVTSQLETLTTADTALGTRIDSLTTSLGDTKADIIATNKTFVAEDEALALSIGALTTTLDDNTADINTRLESLVTQDASFASDLSSLSVRFGTAENTIAQNSVDILAETSARADAISAQATKTDTLEVKVDGNNSSITSRLDAEVTKTNATAESLTVLRGEFDTNSAEYINKFKSITDAASAEAIKLDAVTTEFGTNKSTVASEITTINNAAASLAEQVTQLSSNFNTNTTDYTTKFKALTDKDISLGTAITDLSASFTAIDGIARQNTVDITEESRVRADAVSAEAARITALTTKVDGNIAEVNTKTDALTTSVAANASQLTTIAGEVAGNKATIKTNNDVQVALNAVTANKLDYVSAEIEGGYSDKTHYALKNKTIQWTRTTSIAEALFNSNEKINKLNSEFGQNVATFSDSIKTLANENMALSERTTELSANFEADKVQNTANITSINQALANNTESITQQKTDITAAYKKAIDDIEIGGRNLLLNSDTVLNSDRFLSINVYDIFADIVGQTVTISLDLRVDTHLRDIYIYPYQDSGITIDRGYYFKPDELNSWQRFAFAFTVKDNGPIIEGRTMGSVALYDYMGNNQYVIKNIKIERGNKATDWTPAPEDVTDYIDTEVTRLSGIIDSKATISRVDEVENNANQALATSKIELTGSYTTAITVAKGESATDATGKANEAERLAKAYADTKVSDLKNIVDAKAAITRVDEIENNANQALATAKTELTSSFKSSIDGIEIGGRNLVLDTGIMRTEIGVDSANITNSDGVLTLISNGTELWKGSPSIEVKAGVSYTVSIRAKAENLDVGLSMPLYYDSFWHGPYKTYDKDTSGKWVTISETFIPNTDSIMRIAIHNHNNTTGIAYYKQVKIERGNKATDWTPAPEDVTDYIDTEVTRLSGIIDSKASITRVDEIENNANQSLATSKTELTGSYTSAINQASSASATDAQTKADAAKSEAKTYADTKVAELKTVVDSKATISRVDQIENNANQALATAKTELTGSYTTAIDDIEVGGRNLLLDSKLNITTDNYHILSRDIIEDLQVGEIVTLRIKGNLASNKERFLIYDSIGETELHASPSIRINGYYTYTFPWKRGVSNTNSIGIWQHPAGVIGTSTIDTIKLEKGNKATDWSPAPEDVEADYTAKISTEATTRANEDGALSTRINDVKATADNAQARVGTVETAVATNTGAIAQTKTELTASFKQGIENISVGGTNLQRNSDWVSDIKYEYAVWGDIQSALEKVPAGSEITISFDVEMSKGHFIQAYCSNTYGSTYFIGEFIFRDIGTTKRRLSFTTVTAAASAPDRQTHLEFYSTYGSGDLFKISNVKIEKGNKATDWSPAPEDIIKNTPGENTFSNLTDITTLEIWDLARNPSAAPNGFYLTGAQSGKSSVRLHNVITGNGWWTVSFKMRGTQSSHVSCAVDICDNPNIKSFTTNNTDTYQTYSHSVFVDNYSSTYNFVDISGFYWAYFYIDDIKVEKGKVSTPWSVSAKELSATITQVNRVEAGLAGIKAEASVITTVGNKVSGWKNLNTGVTSNFDVWADRFTVWSGSSLVAPFIIENGNIRLNGNVTSSMSISAPIITGGSIKGVSIEVGATENTAGCELGTILKANPSGFQILSRDASGGIELSSSTRALTVWEGDKIRVKVGKLS